MQRIACSVVASCLLLLSVPVGAQALVSATTDGPSNVTRNAATLKGSIFSPTSPAQYRFQYGTTTNLGFATPVRSVGAFLPYTVAESISGLSPGTVYYYRVISADTGVLGLLGSTSNGAIQRFNTSGSSGSNSGSGSGTGNSGTSSGGSAKPEDGLGGSGNDDKGSGKGGSDDNKGGSGKGSDDLPPAGAAPKLEQSVAVARGSGSVTVKLPGAAGYRRLETGSVIPTGSVIDTLKGSVNLTSALPSGSRQTGRFRGGIFKIGQSRNGYVDLYLRGATCKGKKARGKASISKRRRGKARRLFGSDKGGRFRTHGRNSHATVRGTKWVVEDRCDGTLTRVTEGAVDVRDFAKKRTVRVKAGESYLARPRR